MTSPSATVRFELTRAAELGEDDLRRMLALLEREHPRWPYTTPLAGPLDHLRWKSSGPDGEGLVVRAHEGGELVALMLAFSSRAFLAGRAVARNHLNDSTTSSGHQGRGLSKPRHQAFSSSERGRAPHLEITRVENPLAQSVMARRGFRTVECPIDRYLRVLDTRRFAADWFPGRRRPGVGLALQAAGHLISRSRFGAGRSRPLTISSLESFGAPEDALFERVAPAFDLICDRRSAFMNWRYRDPRAGSFSVRSARDEDSAVGYCVSLVDRGRGRIVDLLTDPGRPEAAVALLLDAVQSLRRQGASGALAWVPRRHPQRAMKAAGFVRLPGPARLAYRAVGLEGNLDLLADPRARVHFCLGDTDEV